MYGRRETKNEMRSQETGSNVQSDHNSDKSPGCAHLPQSFFKKKGGA